MSETIEQYFKRPDTPAAGSPVGVLMVKIQAKFPQLSFEEMRAKANDLLQIAARRRHFTIPPVLTDEEQAQSVAKMKAAFAKNGQQATPRPVAVLGAPDDTESKGLTGDRA